MDDQSPLDLHACEAGDGVLCLAHDRAAFRDAMRSSLATAGEETAVLIVATDDARGAVDDLRERGVPPESIGVVDASGAETVIDGVAEADVVADPGSLSALGIAISDLVDRLGHRFDTVWIGLDSTTAVVERSTLPATFRFLHVLIGRVRTSEAVLVGTLDASVHDEEAQRTIAQLFDRTVPLDEASCEEH